MTHNGHLLVINCIQYKSKPWFNIGQQVMNTNLMLDSGPVDFDLEIFQV